MRTRNAEISKKNIIENAKYLFSKKGFSSTSMDELASICNLNKAMIFYYYKNKQGLFEEVMKEVLVEIYNNIKKENLKCKTPKEKLKNFIYTYASFASNHPYLPSLLLKELSDSGAIVPEQLFTNMQQLYSLFSSILNEGEKSGDFHDVMPMSLYFMIIGTINLMITTKKLRLKAHKTNMLNTSSDKTIDDISAYLTKKIIISLEA